MKVYILQCDCFLQKVDVIHSEEEWKEYADQMVTGQRRYGFSSSVSVCQGETEEKGIGNLRALIYFTDGDGIYPRQKPDYETAFVFLERSEKMKLVPDWALCLITGQKEKK